jgi:16S rRNA (uracil1498-N3)-methyltransferase
MHCFFSENIDESGAIISLGDRENQHLFKTLRARRGDKVRLMDGKGKLALCEVTEAKELRVLEVDFKEKPELRVHLFVAPPRKQKMDMLLKQCTEAGVWSINPIITERSVAVPEKASVLNRWGQLLMEACKQSVNPFLPEVRELIDLSSALKLVKDSGMPGFYGTPGGQVARECKPSGDVAWFVGPEGGFSPAEEELLDSSGIKGICIGPWIMRVETAAVCGISVLGFLGA